MNIVTLIKLDKVTPGSIDLLQKLIVAQLIKELTAFNGSECAFLH
jgi:hypothetical protein